MSRGIGTLVLAAGLARRFGSPKQLAEVEGEPMVHRAARIALEALLEPVVVVLGAEAAKVERALGDLPVARVLNHGFARGQASSISLGLATLAASEAATLEAALILPCDMPYLRAATLRRLADTWADRRPAMTLPLYGGRRGAPAVVARRVFPRLMALEGDQGGRVLWPELEGDLTALPIDDPREGLDVDRAADLPRS